MNRHIPGMRERAKAQAEELLAAIAAAETIIVSTIERECEALRTRRMLAAEALHLRVCDASKLYVNATRAARASLWTIEQILPGSGERFEERRAAFAHVLKIELAVLAAERQAAGDVGTPVAPAARPAVRPSAGAAVHVLPTRRGPAQHPTRARSFR